MKRGCAGDKNIPLPLPGRQYIAKANQVQPSRLIKDVEFLSEGILSFVEHAPRLLIVQPSRLDEVEVVSYPRASSPSSSMHLGYS